MSIKNTIKSIFLNPRSFFLENLGIRQTIFKNTLWLAVAEGVTRFLKLILIIYVARILGATEYGKFTFALAFVTLFAIFYDLGLSQITTRELSQKQDKEKEEYPAVVSLKILFGLITLVLIFGGSFFITTDPIIQKTIWILAFYILFVNFSDIVYAFFRARQRMEYESLSKIIQALVVTVVGFLVILNFPSIVNLSYSYLFSSLIALIFILIFFHFKLFPLKISWQKSIWQKFLAMSWPLAIAGMLGTVYSQIDSVMMGYLGQVTQTGWYNAAYKIIGVTLIPSGLIAQGLFPVLSRLFKESAEKLQNIWNYFTEAMVFLAFPIVVGGIVLAPRIIDWIYDPSFFPTGKEAILAFQILIGTAGIIFLATPLIQILIVSNHQNKLFWVTLSGAVVNVALNLILIPKYSLYGAAIATVITYLLIFSILFKFVSKFTSVKIFDLKFLLSLFGVLLASGVMYFFISQPLIYNLNILLSILIGASIYSVAFIILKILVKRFV